MSLGGKLMTWLHDATWGKRHAHPGSARDPRFD